MPRHVRFDLGKASTAPIRVVSAIGQLYELSDSARAASRHVDFARRWHSCKSLVEHKMSLNLADLAHSLSDSDSTTATPNPALNDPYLHVFSADINQPCDQPSNP